MQMAEENRILFWGRRLRMTKKLQILILFVLLICTSSCGKLWVEPVIFSPIEIYSPAMSSVPGFPLEVELKIDGETPHVFSIKLTVNNGSFLDWGDDMVVSNLGKTADYKGKPIYWTPFEDNGKLADRARITVVVLYMEKIGEAESKATINIYKDKDGMYTFNK